MASLRSWLVRNLLVKGFMRKLSDPNGKDIEICRKEFNDLAKSAKLPPGTTVERVTAANLPAEWVRAANVPKEQDAVILHIHGGGYIGSCSTHRNLAALISAAAGMPVLVVEYRLAPEHKYPAANEDCLAVYDWLLSEGIPAGKIILSGDSYGAGLALMTLLAIRDAGKPLPAATLMMSPWDFVKFDGESYTSRAKIDPYTNLKNYQLAAGYYLEGAAVWPVSLLDQDFSGLSPLFMQVGDHEVVLSDALRLAERAENAGISVKLEVWEKMWHGFQSFAGVMPEAKRALRSMGEFVKSRQ